MVSLQRIILIRMVGSDLAASSLLSDGRRSRRRLGRNSETPADVVAGWSHGVYPDSAPMVVDRLSMNLLVVSFWLPPFLEPQSIQIGRLLAHLPSDLRQYVFTADHSTATPDKSLYPGIERNFAGFLRRPYEAGLPRRALRRLFRFFNLMPDPYLCWHFVNARHIWKAWPDVKFDRIVTFPCPMSSAVFGYWLKRRLNIPWITFMSDPWADNPYFGYSGLLRIINNRLEELVVHNADRIVVPSAQMRTRLAERRPSCADKLSVLEHSFDPSLYPPCSPAEAGPLVIRYLGSYGGLRSAEPIFKALGMLKAHGQLGDGEVKFQLVGTLWRGDRCKYRQLVRSLGLQEEVELKAGVGYLESLKLMCEAHVLMIIDGEIEGSVYFPSKLVDYLGAGRPILAVTPIDGASAGVVIEAGGRVANPGDIGSIANEILKLVEDRRSGRLEDLIPRVEIRERFSIGRQISNVVELFKF